MNLNLIIKKQKDFFSSGKTKDVNFRINMLKKLKKVIKENENKIYDGLKKDLNKSGIESYLTEILSVYSEIDFAIKNLKRWSRPSKKIFNPMFLFSKNYIINEPKGHILIVSPWNYPIYLTIIPIVSAISSGNVVFVKPSEMSKNSSNILLKLINENFSSEFLYVALGDEKFAKELLKYKFDHIFFTGSTNVGRIVYQKAAETITPVTLELGGKSPIIIDDDKFNLKFAMKRIAWGKMINAGQTCVAPDYLLIRRDVFYKIKDDLIFYFNKLYEDYGKDYPKIINEKHFLRLKKLIDNFEKRSIIYGGSYNLKNLKIQPTLVLNSNINSKIMKDEIFGPILPIIFYDDLSDAINIIKEKENPLTCYLFSTKKKVQRRIGAEISCGSLCINDTLIQLSSKKLPFGGVGNSGFGRSHGKFGFLEFSNIKTVVKNTYLLDIVLRYPPFTKKKYKRLLFLKRFL